MNNLQSVWVSLHLTKERAVWVALHVATEMAVWVALHVATEMAVWVALHVATEMAVWVDSSLLPSSLLRPEQEQFMIRVPNPLHCTAALYTHTQATLHTHMCKHLMHIQNIRYASTNACTQAAHYCYVPARHNHLCNTNNNKTGYFLLHLQ